MADAGRPTARRGAGVVLVAVYVLFTVAAGARSTIQLVRGGGEAPVAYSLSLVAAAIYLLGAIALWQVTRGATTVIARVWCLVELTGVVVVGTLSLVRPEWFPHASVWSGFGSGYGFVPAVLPLLALWWLRSVDRRRRQTG